VTRFPNFQRLYIESTPLRSPRLLLERLDKLIRGRKELGLPLQFIDAKVNCEALILIAEHSAFLTAWGWLVEEDVRVEYSRGRVEKLPRRGVRMFHLIRNGEVVGDDEEDGAIEYNGGCELDWDGWISGKWPKTASEMKG